MENSKKEIIYISSDDDEDIKQNNVDNKQSVVKVLENNNHHPKIVEEVSRNHKNAINHGQKRKLSNVSDNDDSCSEKCEKVFVCEKENGPKACKIKSNKEEKIVRRQEENKTLLKPKLVPKEIKPVSPDKLEQDTFCRFISLCLQKDRCKDMEVIVSKLKRHYERLDPKYANCEGFVNFLNEKRIEIMNSTDKLYTYIQEVMNEMKNIYKGNSRLLLNNNDCLSKMKSLNKNDESNVPSTLSSNVNNRTIDDSKEISADEKLQEEEASKERKIRKLSKIMQKCKNKIKKLEETEVNFDEEENSNYIMLETYKLRMVQLFNKYCEYTGENPDANRQYLRPKHFSTETGIVSLDNAITSFINSKIVKKRKSKKMGPLTEALIFPDYGDILNCVARCNETNNLDLDTKKQQQLAEKAFKQIGEHLQLCRRTDYWDTFSMFLENQEDDPAVKDTILAEKLMQNKKQGEMKLAKVFQEYVEKQENIKESDEMSKSRASSEKEEDEEHSVKNDSEDDEDCSENEISETEINSLLDRDKISEDEDENSRDKDDTPKNKAELNAEKSDVNIIEMQNTEKIKSNDRLKGSDDDNLNPENDVQNTNCKGNFGSKSIEDNGSISLFKVQLAKEQLNVSTSKTTIENNEIPIDEAKDEESSIINEDPSAPTDKMEQEEDKDGEKPLLRLRSFAIPPITWKEAEKLDEHNENANISKISTDKDVIDLTEDSPKANHIVGQPIPLVINRMITIGKHKVNGDTNITNNYVTVNNIINNVNSGTNKLEKGEIVRTKCLVMDKNVRSTITRVPGNQSGNQQFKRTIRILPKSNHVTVIPMKQKESTSQLPKTCSNIQK